MWGRSPRGSNGVCSTLCWFSVTPSTTHNQIGPFWCCFLSGWVCVHSRTLWVSLTNSPVSLGVSPTAASTPTGVFNQWFEALFPCAGTLGCTVCLPGPWSTSCCLSGQLQLSPPCCTICHLTGSISCHLATCPFCPAAHLCPLTCLDECFFFISLVVRLPYSSIFCQFWLFFVFKLLLSFLWLCEAHCVYLGLHLGQKSESSPLIRVGE